MYIHITTEPEIRYSSCGGTEKTGVDELDSILSTYERCLGKIYSVAVLEKYKFGTGLLITIKPVEKGYSFSELTVEFQNYSSGKYYYVSSNEIMGISRGYWATGVTFEGTLAAFLEGNSYLIRERVKSYEKEIKWLDSILAKKNIKPSRKDKFSIIMYA